MRVALACPYDIGVPGGVQAQVLGLAGALREIGDEVLVVAPGDGSGPPDVETVGGSLGVRFNRSVAPIAWSPLAARAALGAVRRFGPDVVHIHEPAVPVISLALALRCPRPIVATFHAWSDRDRLYRAARPALRPVLRRLDARIAVSPPAARYHADALGVEPDAFRIVPNAVDVARFRDAVPPPEPPPGPTLLFVGRLEPRKGPVQVVGAYARLRADHPDLRLVVVGSGSEERRCRDALPTRLADGVTFAGTVAAEELPRYHAAADVFVAPALGGESFGIVLVEAMAAGLPVVASAIPGYRSVVEDGRTGLLVHPGDDDALVDALDGLLRDPQRRQRLAEAGRETARRYDWDQVAGQVRGIYDEVVGQTRS